MRRSRNISQRGFTLVEMLVSTAIFMFIVFAIYYLFDRGQWMYLTSERRTNMQENGRLLMEAMERDMRMIAMGVPRGTQVGGEVTWLPEVFLAGRSQIGFRGDVDSNNSQITADLTSGSTSVSVPNGEENFACPPTSEIVIVDKNRRWLGFTCSNPSPGSITITPAMTATFSAPDAEIFSLEHVWYRLTPDADSNGVCDVAGANPDYSNCLVQRATRYLSTPTTTVNGNDWETLATNIRELRFQYFQTNSPPTPLTSLPLSAADLFNVDMIRVTIVARERASDVKLTQDHSFVSDILIRKRKLL